MAGAPARPLFVLLHSPVAAPRLACGTRSPHRPCCVPQIVAFLRLSASFDYRAHLFSEPLDESPHAFHRTADDQSYTEALQRDLRLSGNVRLALCQPEPWHPSSTSPKSSRPTCPQPWRHDRVAAPFDR
eukprot:755069-Prymnesium_polylepis.1